MERSKHCICVSRNIVPEHSHTLSLELSLLIDSKGVVELIEDYGFAMPHEMMALSEEPCTMIGRGPGRKSMHVCERVHAHRGAHSLCEHFTASLFRSANRCMFGH